MSFDRQMVDEVNQLRKDPKKYAEKINKYIDYFDGNVLNLPGRKSGIRTHEGPKAFKEAVNYLSRQKAVEPLSPSKALFRIAQDFLRRIQRKNSDANSIDVDALIDKYGTYYGDFIRATDYGGQTPEQSIINLIVSDGDPNRVQRQSLLSTSYTLIGAATGTHPIFHNCTVIFTCSEFENNKDAEDIGFLDGSSFKKAATVVEPKPQPQPNSQRHARIQSQDQPKAQQQQPVEKEQPQSRFQPRYQRQAAQPQTQPQSQPQTKEQPQSRYQPRYQRQTAQPQAQEQPKAQPQTKEQPQSRYQPKYQRQAAQPQAQEQPKAQPQTQSQPRYQWSGRARTTVENKVQPQTRAQPQAKYQSKWGAKKEEAPEEELKVVSENRKEKMSMEGGKKIKEITIERIMSDGSTQVETLISDA